MRKAEGTEKRSQHFRKPFLERKVRAIIKPDKIRYRIWDYQLVENNPSLV